MSSELEKPMQSELPHCESERAGPMRSVKLSRGAQCFIFAYVILVAI